MICEYCKGTGQYKDVVDKERFEDLVDREMDKAYTVNRIMAEEKVLKKVQYKTVTCPHCNGTGKINREK